MKRKLLFAIAALLCSVGSWAQTDVTSYLTNPSFETGDMTGWTSYGYNPENNEGEVDASSFGGSKLVADYPLSDSDGEYICDFYGNRWTGWWSYYTISQSVLLPAGEYQLTAILGSSNGYTVSLFAFPAGSGELNAVATYSNISSETLNSDDQNNVGYLKTVTFTSDGTTPMVLGAGLVNSKSVWGTFFKADNFKLYRLPSDVTNSYLTNPGFDSDYITANKSTSSNNAVTGWTKSADKANSCGAAVEYGSSYTLNGKSIVAKDKFANGDGGALGITTGWSQEVTYTQDVTLPAGSYKVTFDVINQNSGYTGVNTNKFGWVPNSGSAVYSNVKTFIYNMWQTISVEFTLASETAGKISVGGIMGTGKSNECAILFIDHVKILRTDNSAQSIDYSDKINQGQWSYNEDDGSGSNNSLTGNVNKGDLPYRHVERYRGNGTHYGKKLYQSVTLPAGVYEVKASCMSAAANGVEGNYALADNTLHNAFFYANDVALTYPLANATSSLRKNYVYLAEEGSVEFGIKTNRRGANWSAIGHASIVKVGNTEAEYQHIMLPILQSELSSLLTTAVDLRDNKKMTKTGKSNITKAVTTYSATDVTDFAAVKDAVSKMQDAVKDAMNSHYEYTIVLKAKYDNLVSNQVTPQAQAATATTLAAHYDASYWDTVDEMLADYQAIEIENLGTTSGTSFTSVILNNSFELDQAATNSPTGWTIPNKGADYGARALGSSGSTYYMTNADGSYVFNNWQNWWMTCNLSQTITGLPNGEYELTAVIAGYSDAYTNLTANGESTVCATAGEAVGVKTTVTAFVSDGTLVIGADNTGCYHKSGDNWQTFLKVDKFELTYNGIKPLLKDLIDEAQDIVDEGVNVGTDPFQIPASAQSTLDDAIDDAELVYDNGSATFDDVQDAIDDLNAAIRAYKNATLVAPASGVQYRIKSTAADAADWKNKYYVLKKGGNESQGGYSIRAEGSDAAYLATAWQFTSVSGNDYKLSMIDADGTTRYICTAIKGYDTGSATQIRTTTDASKALVVKVIAATGSEGRWYLQNTEDDSYIGGQDAGMYSNSQNYDLAIEAATQASVPVNLAAGKYGTRIFPFTPSAIDGITYYSCETVKGSDLKMDEVAELAANTPYILCASKDVNETLEGWGTASTTSYEAGYLTGQFAEKEITSGYVLQTISEKQAFYVVDSGDPITVPAYRAYLTVLSGDVKAFFLDFDDVDGIKAIDNGQLTMDNAKIYNLAGQRLNKAQKGVNIVNGKKVLVK